MNKLKVFLISIFALCLFTTNISATQDYDPGFEYDHTLYNTKLVCEFCGCDDWYVIIDEEFNMDIVVCMTCAYWDYWV